MHFLPDMNELVFIVTQEADGGFIAEALGGSIITVRGRGKPAT